MYDLQLRRTYTDPDLMWGDAAVPDDTAWIQRAIELLMTDTGTRKGGLPVLDVALAVGRAEAEVRELVKPQRRSGGFTRPRYLTYANKAKTHVKAIGCPHGGCKGRRFATHVALLPEVAASGLGVICAHCRRAPAEHTRGHSPSSLSSTCSRGPTVGPPAAFAQRLRPSLRRGPPSDPFGLVPVSESRASHLVVTAEVGLARTVRGMSYQVT